MALNHFQDPFKVCKETQKNCSTGPRSAAPAGLGDLSRDAGVREHLCHAEPVPAPLAAQLGSSEGSGSSQDAATHRDDASERLKFDHR